MNQESEQYIVQKTGRVKAAGVPMDGLFDAVGSFADSPTVSRAEDVTGYFARLRAAPSDEIRDRFFPRDRANKGLFKSSPLLLRPILKTDQGPGRFLSFETSEDVAEIGTYHIDLEQGYCILEEFFSKQLDQIGNPKELTSAIADVREKFSSGDMREAQLAYERLQLASEAHGVEFQREARVGRDAMFFIRPNLPTQKIVLPHKVREKVASFAQGQFTDFAKTLRATYAKEHALLPPEGPIYLPIYYQVDAQISPDGETLIEQLHMPDVGLFLTTLEPFGNRALFEVKSRVKPIGEAVFEAIAATAADRNVDTIALITRPEVLENQEDTLEIREIAALQDGLTARGFHVSALSVEKIHELSGMGVLLNVHPQDASFDGLLRFRLDNPDVPIFPDPFLLLKRELMSSYGSMYVPRTHLADLQTIVQGGESLSQLLALDNYLTKHGYAGDVFHIFISSQPTPIACFRYDIRGFQIALNAVRDGDEVRIRSIPIHPRSAVLFDKDKRAIYSVFRFMAVRRTT
jgi:hypothetical protein